MSSYNKVNGTYTSESPALLTGVLRDDWGFDGLVMTDWFGGRDAVAQMKAGNELLMPGTARQQQDAPRRPRERGAQGGGARPQRRAHPRARSAARPTFQGYAHSDAPDLKAHAQVGRDGRRRGHGAAAERRASCRSRASAKLALLGNTLLQHDHRGHGQRRRQRGLLGLARRGAEGRGARGRRRARRELRGATSRSRRRSGRPRRGRSCRSRADPRDGGARRRDRPARAGGGPGARDDRPQLRRGPRPQARGRLRALRRREGAAPGRGDGVPRAEEEGAGGPEHRRGDRDRELARRCRTPSCSPGSRGRRRATRSPTC